MYSERCSIVSLRFSWQTRETLQLKFGRLFCKCALIMLCYVVENLHGYWKCKSISDPTIIWQIRVRPVSGISEAYFSLFTLIHFHVNMLKNREKFTKLWLKKRSHAKNSVKYSVFSIIFIVQKTLNCNLKYISWTFQKKKKKSKKRLLVRFSSVTEKIDSDSVRILPIHIGYPNFSYIHACL